MAEFFIRIKKDTLRPNPRAGESRSFVPGPVITNEDGSQECERIEINSRPAPKMLFDYEDTEVECDNCHKKFCFKLLLDNEDWENGDGEVCPHCGEPYCCELRFETPEEAEKRKD